MKDQEQLRDELEQAYEVAYRSGPHSANPRAALALKNEVSGRRKMAQKSRYRRGGKAAFFNGAHRRRDKRNHL